ncbi:UNVERIFIED_CONTAM: Fatty acid amide hydrolase [Sesamum radiatum]|uniref:Fatty acid amide hydrolase n=1 Tax=Sesamum radiatum TaxID=300843 RepID=A0AAW2RYB1_SESRA
MGKKKVMLPADEVDMATVKYQYEKIEAPHLTGISLKLFVRLLETPIIGSLIISHLKQENKMVEMLRNTVIPEAPMFKPEFPPQEPEPEVVLLDEDGKPEERVELALKTLPHYDPANSWIPDSSSPFRYWRLEIMHMHTDLNLRLHLHKKPPTPLLISYDPELIRKQAAASTQRFEDGGTTFFHEVRPVEEDAVPVARLRKCGVILVGKANMHELGLGTTGNNPNHGTARNPHSPERYTGGSSSGPAAIVASGLCSAALGTDGGGSVRIPSSLCGVVGLKSTYGRTDMSGSICDSGTVEIIGPITSTVEDAILVYAAILGSSTAENRLEACNYLKHSASFFSFRSESQDPLLIYSSNSSLPCLPNLTSREDSDVLGSLRLGKYTEWFNDVFSTDISDKCEDVLNHLLETHGCKIVEIIIPELHEMRTAHIVSIGSESACGLNPDFEDGKRVKFTHDTRTNLALFRSFSASDYVAAQCLRCSIALYLLYQISNVLVQLSLRRRLMYYHMEIFKKVDVIITPTTGMTAPVIPPASLSSGETNLQVSGKCKSSWASSNICPTIFFSMVTSGGKSFHIKLYIYEKKASVSFFFVLDNLQSAVLVNTYILPVFASNIQVGYDKQGLPIGLQIIGRPWCEATILRLAAAVEVLFSQ